MKRAYFYTCSPCVCFRTCHQARGYETPSRETILLREKAGVPPGGMDLHQVDSGHCSLDIGAGDIQTQHSPTRLSADDPPTGGPPTARIGFVRHQRVVKINGNDYAHVWEAPLPEASTSRLGGGAYRTMIRAPIGSEGCTCMYHIKPAMCPVPPPTVSPAAAADGAAAVAAATAAVNAANAANCAIQQHQQQQQQQTDTLKYSTAGRQRTYQKSPTTYEPPRYSTLERKGLYGNSSSV